MKIESKRLIFITKSNKNLSAKLSSLKLKEYCEQEINIFIELK